MVIEVEVDTLEQLDAVLPARPDIVLLDNMSPADLREAVDGATPSIGRSNWRPPAESIWQRFALIAESGVDRISVGALTHSAVSLDFGLDWAGAA